MSELPDRLRGAVLDADRPSSLAARARRKRWNVLLQRFPRLSEMRVLDLGGTVESWEAAPVRPTHVTLLNLDHRVRRLDWLETLEGDACEPPPAVLRSSFDLVYSNSVIEHVGGRWRRRAFAETARRCGGHHWIQTPARTFPIEPHWLFPYFQVFPVPVRAWISRHWPLGYIRGGHRLQSVDDVLQIDLVFAAEMRLLFPDADLIPERALGMTKSLIAVR
jgi:hypothetical protein